MTKKHYIAVAEILADAHKHADIYSPMQIANYITNI